MFLFLCIQRRSRSGSLFGALTARLTRSKTFGEADKKRRSGYGSSLEVDGAETGYVGLKTAQECIAR